MSTTSDGRRSSKQSSSAMAANGVQALVDAKANVNLADRGGITPLEHARQRGYEDIEQILNKAARTKGQEP